MQPYFESRRDYDRLFYIEEKVNDECPPHFHSNIELVYVTSGELEVTVNGQTGRLPAGSLAVSGSFDVHSYHTPECSRSIFLIIPVEMAELYLKLMAGKKFALPFLMPGAHTPELESVLRILQKCDRRSGGLYLHGYLQVVLGMICRALPATVDEHGGEGENLIRNMLLYLEKNHLRPVTLQEMSEVFGYNRAYLSRLFNDRIGMGFNSYVNQLRVRNAARLIHTTGLSMSRVAEESGFSSVRSFNRAFHDQYGITPLEYKRHKESPTETGTEIDRLFGVFSYLPDYESEQ